MKRNILLPLAFIAFFSAGVLMAQNLQADTTLTYILSAVIGILASICALCFNYKRHNYSTPYDPLNSTFMESIKQLQKSTEKLKSLYNKPSVKQ